MENVPLLGFIEKTRTLVYRRKSIPIFCQRVREYYINCNKTYRRVAVQTRKRDLENIPFLKFAIKARFFSTGKLKSKLY